MNYVATIVVNPESARLGLDDEIRAHDTLAALGGEALSSDWLERGEALDIFFDNAEPIKAQQSLIKALDHLPADVICQPSKGRRKSLLAADMDSTIITIECIDEIAEIAGVKDRIVAITEAAMRGEVDFREALRERVAMLAGLPEQALKQVYETRVKLTDGARTLVRTMRASGATTILVSGGFTYFTKRIADDIGFTHHFANELVTDQGKLVGTVLEPILGSAQKLEILIRLRNQKAIDPSATMVVGDGANDIAMILEAGLGIAFHAKPATAAAAPAAINHTGLETLLFAQGYRRPEFSS
jgi:phosphoserine phosphatase